MKKILLACTVLVAASWSTTSAAVSRSLVCNGCTTQQTKDLVKGSPTGDYFVHDVLNRKITHWAVGVGKDIDTLPMTNVPITPAVQEQFDWVQRFYDNLGTLNYNIDKDGSALVKRATLNTLHTADRMVTGLLAADASPPGASMSAFDLINTPGNQYITIQSLQNDGYVEGVGRFIAEWLASFTSHFALTQKLYPVPVNLTVTMHFTDGSSSKFHWNVDTNEWEYALGSGRDAVGNPIPENPDQAVGGMIGRQNYIYPSTGAGVDSANRAAKNFSNIGLPVGVPVFNRGSAWTVACVRVGGPTGTISCTAVPG